jgi:hypothetical protein
MRLISLFVLGVLAVAMSASAQAQTTDPIQKGDHRPHQKGVARRSERGYGQGRHGH